MGDLLGSPRVAPLLPFFFLSARNSPRKRACHGWPLDFQVLRGFLKYFVSFLLRVHRAFAAGGLFCESDNTGMGKNGIWVEEGSQSGSRLRIYELWNALGFSMRGNAHVNKLLR